MKEIYNRLLRLALTVGLTDREAFVDKVSEVIARKTSADPRYGERLGVPTPYNRVLADIVSCVQDNYNNQYGMENG